MLPNMFMNDFGDQVQRFATLIDAKNHQFVLVERIDGRIFAFVYLLSWSIVRGFIKGYVISRLSVSEYYQSSVPEEESL